MKATEQQTVATIQCHLQEGAQCQAEARLRFVVPNESGLKQTIFECPSCGHGISLPLLGSVAFLYEARDSQDFQVTTVGISRWIKEIAFRRAARRLVRQLGERPTSLFDFGCGSGQFTRLLAEELPGARVVGSDFFADPPPELVGLSYVSYTDQEQFAGAFDVVTALHVLEHDENPTALLRDLTRLVRDGGTVIVEVPNIACLWGRVFGRFWDAWYQPYHRQHFSRQSLCRLIEGAGLEVLSCHDVTVPTMGRTLANLAGQHNSLAFLLAGIVLHPVQVVVEWLSGEGSALRIAARSKPHRKLSVAQTAQHSYLSTHIVE